MILSYLTQPRNTIILIAISGALCGIAAMMLKTEMAFSPIPGGVFGLVFAIANFGRRSRLAAFAVVALYTALSAAIYLGAVYFSNQISGGGISMGFLTLMFRAFIAGALAGALLALLTKVINLGPLSILYELRTALIGGVTGVAFVLLAPVAIVAYPVWQVPVAWSLMASIQSNAAVPDKSSENTDS